MTEDFTNHPKSITEIKAHRQEDASQWTPRDALICLLREIDEGKHDIDQMTICFRKKVEGGVQTRYLTAGPDFLMNLGLVNRVAYIMNLTRDS